MKNVICGFSKRVTGVFIISEPRKVIDKQNLGKLEKQGVTSNYVLKKLFLMVHVTLSMVGHLKLRRLSPLPLDLVFRISP